MHIEADAVARRVDEPRLGPLVAAQRGVAFPLVDLTDRIVDCLARGTRRDGLEGGLQGLLGDIVAALDRFGWVAHTERAGHVGVIVRGLPAREDVDDDRFVRFEGATAPIVRVGRVGTTGDDRLVECVALLEEGGLDDRLHSLGGERFVAPALVEDPVLADRRLSKESLGGGHCPLVRALGHTNRLDLGGRLGGAGFGEDTVVLRCHCDLEVAQAVGGPDGKARRDGHRGDVLGSEELGEHAVGRFVLPVGLALLAVVEIREPGDRRGVALGARPAVLESRDEQEDRAAIVRSFGVRGHEQRDEGIGRVEPREVALIRALGSGVEQIAVHAFAVEERREIGEIRSIVTIGSRHIGPWEGAVKTVRHRQARSSVDHHRQSQTARPHPDRRPGIACRRRLCVGSYQLI